MSVTWIAPAATAASSSSTSIREIGAITAARRSGSLTASCNENSEIGTPVVGAALAARPERLAPLVETDREGAKSLERLGLGLDGLAESSSDSRMVSSSSAKSSSSLPSKYW